MITFQVDEKALQAARENLPTSPNGGLFNMVGYIDWEPKTHDITLDGHFTAVELLAIAEYMLQHQ
jgi:hypothetical protein